ncbi:MAG: hypothetical protein NC226_09610 [Bacteroides cellulosilyticus]|nr:hypothetical protein [Bacteroides cellulosilyticus]
MRTTLRKACAVVGGTAFLTGAAFVGESLAYAVVWLTVSVSLIFAGQAFTFQQKQ